MRFKLKGVDKVFISWTTTTWNGVQYYEGVVTWHKKMPKSGKKEAFALCMGKQVITEKEHYIVEKDITTLASKPYWENQGN
jgi:ureidoglycolate hydrolase